jgi:hypothetical protein
LVRFIGRVLVTLASAAPLCASPVLSQSITITDRGAIRLEAGGSRVVIDAGGIEVRAGGDAEVAAGGDAEISVDLTGAEVLCDGTDRLEIRARKLTTDGVAIIARDNCELRVESSQITSRAGVAIVVEDNAEVHLASSQVIAPRISVLLLENASASASSSKFLGKVVAQSENAEFADRGSNRWERGTTTAVSVRSTAPVAAPETAAPATPKRQPRTRAGAGPMPPMTCGNGGKLVLRKCVIDTDQTAVTARGNCTVLIEDCTIESTGTAVDLADTVQATIVRSDIFGATALRYTGSSVVSVRDSVISGEQVKSGRAELRDQGGNAFQD